MNEVDARIGLSRSSEFANLMRVAATMRNLADDPIHLSWWKGYMRGLCRAYYEEGFGTEADHEFWLSAAAAPDEQRAASGRGYLSGLKLQFDSPE